MKRFTETVRRKGLSRKQLFEPLPVEGLRGSGGPGLEIVTLERGREFRRRSEKFPGLGWRKARKLGRLEIGGAPVGCFDEGLQRLRQLCRQPEAKMDRREQPPLDRLVAVADHR